MKKILLLSFILLASSTFALVPVPDTSSAMTLMSPSELLEQATKDIDRRLAGLNRFIQARNLDSIKNLVSEENKDFHANFLKFIENAPAFTIKRSLAEKIIITPQDEYSFSALMTLNGKEEKVSMSFIEEEGEQGTKWVILNSNLHIIGKTLFVPSDIPAVPVKKEPLASSALGNTNTSSAPTPVTVTPSDIPPTVEDSPIVAPSTSTSMSSEVVVLPPVKMDFPPIVTPIKKIPSSSLTDTTATQGTTFPILNITIGVTLLLVLVGGIFYYNKRKKSIGNALLAASLATVSAAPVTSTIDTTTTPVVSETPQEVPSVHSTAVSDGEIAPNPATVPSLPITETIISEQNISNVSLVQPDSLTDTLTMEDVIVQPEIPVQEPEIKEVSLSQEGASSQAEMPLMLPQEKDIFLPPSASESGENVMEPSTEARPATEEKIVTPTQHADEDIFILSQKPEDEAPSSSTLESPEVGTPQDSKTRFALFVESRKNPPTTPEITPDIAPNGSVA